MMATRIEELEARIAALEEGNVCRCKVNVDGDIYETGCERDVYGGHEWASYNYCPFCGKKIVRE